MFHILICLEYLHRQMLKHGNLKPENIFKGKNGIYRVSDVGWKLKICEKKQFQYYDKVNYLPPEFFEKGKFDFYLILKVNFNIFYFYFYLFLFLLSSYLDQSDVWSLGVVTLEFATGKHPFPLNPKSPKEVYSYSLNPFETNVELIEYYQKQEYPKFIYYPEKCILWRNWRFSESLKNLIKKMLDPVCFFFLFLIYK